MNKSIFTAIAVALLIGQTAFAAPQGASYRGILGDLRNLTEKCVVRPYTVNRYGEKVLLPLQSTCQELIVTSERQATLILAGQNFYAEVIESQDSDGGDLTHLIIRNTHGRVIATRRNVLAFGNVLIGLVAGQENFPEVRQ